MLRSRKLLIMSSLMLASCSRAQSVAEPARDLVSTQQSNSVTHWHLLATELVVDVGPVIDGRAFAIIQAAVHDAVNGIERRYEPYTANLTAPGASLDAAVAAAAHDVLSALVPQHQAKIASEYVAALAAVPDGSAKEAGVALGHEAARLNLDRRASDGIPVAPWPPTEGPITEPVFEPTGAPGDYAFTPPFDQPPLGPIALFPGWGRLTPFVIDLEKHKLKGPDPIKSRRYARDLEYVESIGRLNSSTRTDDQTEIAFFWFESLAIWNQIASELIATHGLDEWDAAHRLALLNFAMTDASIACFDAKYHFRFWRPFTAIRRADEDDNRFTQPDADWLPLLWTEPDVFPPTFLIPPIPDYPSAAAVIAAAAGEVLIRHFGDRQRFQATSAFLPGAVRHFTTISQAVEESGMSRVYGGIHFQRAVEDGFRQGRSIGRVVSRMLPPAEW